MGRIRKLIAQEEVYIQKAREIILNQWSWIVVVFESLSWESNSEFSGSVIHTFHHASLKLAK